MSRPLGHERHRELEFDKSAQLVRPEQAEDLAALAGQVDDLLVLSHGWNNDMREARDLYQRIVESIDAQRDAGHEPELAGRTVGYLGVLWPSKKFADEDLTPGGAAGVGEPDPTLRADVLARKDAFAAGDAERTLTEAAALVPKLKHSPAARARYVDLLRRLIDRSAEDQEDAGSAFFLLDSEEIFRRVDDPTLGDPELFELARPGVQTGRTLGIPAAGALTDLSGGIAPLSGLQSTGRRLLNYVTYYEMKNRAGLIGAALSPLLGEHVLGRTCMHLAGHSFGARLVTAAAANLPPALSRESVASMSLLQAAFSHYSFAKEWEPRKDGTFRPVLTGGILTGPVIVTHTRRDRAVGIAYAVASRIAGQVAAAIGDANSRFGGLGSNGAQRTPEAVTAQLLKTDANYEFARNGVYNLRADDIVTSHGNVSNRPVAHAVLRAMAANG
jgi:hypothetical protein